MKQPVTMSLDGARALVAEIPDFPQPGIRFQDLTPVIADAGAFAAVVDALVTAVPAGSDLVIAVEARGFLFGAALARATGMGVVPVRKPGKLPAVAYRVDYSLEYGTATLELPAGTAVAGSGVFVVDDVLATGGTVAAACSLAEQAGGAVTGVGIVLELSALGGRARLSGREVHAIWQC